MPKQKLPDKDFVWTSELAYVVGLLTTDGNLSRDGCHINMRSSEKDLLNTFKKCLGIKNKIGSTKNQRGLRVQFGDAQFYRWLLKIGLFPAKTYTIGEIPDKFFRDFVRGHLDGDGSISAYIDRFGFYKGRNYTNQRLFLRFISASKNHIDWLRRKIVELAGVRGAAIIHKPASDKHVPIYEIKFAKKESIKLLNWIYYQKDLPCLKRKRIIAENTIRKIAKEKRREYAFIK